MDKQTHAAMGEFLADLQVQADASDARDALGWVILCIDLAYGRMTVYGPPFADPIVALTKADEMDRNVHQGITEGEPGWKHIVLPVIPHG